MFKRVIPTILIHFFVLQFALGQYFPEKEWERKDPQSQKVNVEKLKEAVDFAILFLGFCSSGRAIPIFLGLAD